MKTITHVAFFSPNVEYHRAESFEDAEKWLQDQIKEYSEDGYAECLMAGESFISEVTHKTHYNITDRKENYCINDCLFCNSYDHENDKCKNDSEQWPYDIDFDNVGEIVLKSIKPSTEIHTTCGATAMLYDENTGDFKPLNKDIIYPGFEPHNHSASDCEKTDKNDNQVYCQIVWDGRNAKINDYDITSGADYFVNQSPQGCSINDYIFIGYKFRNDTQFYISPVSIENSKIKAFADFAVFEKVAR